MKVEFEKEMSIVLKAIRRASKGWDGEYSSTEKGWALKKAHAYAEAALKSGDDVTAAQAVSFFVEGMRLPVDITLYR